ncbi:hypothetical protein L484_027923 [Morus notabilis]|uniref:t-SNARE coiled-coil homology domain-containing protein n=1 Tax=Morus notabilis TaxID=981085 RepID=W9SFJ4_9ROSA|nr:hypothetical protein L484_027923 [Morus notabilis]
MASSSDPWMRELSDASKLADEVRDMISQRSSLLPSGPQTQRHMSTARRKMTILRTKLETLQSLLSKLPSKQILSAKETNRRRDMLDKLSVQAGEMAPTLNMSMSADRDNLFGLNRKQDDMMKKANDLDNHEQDEDFAQLEETVVSTKHIALAVNEELDLQTRLLDNLDEHVDSTNSRLQVRL